MSNYPHPIFAREGWLFIGLSFIVALLTTFISGFWSAAPLWLVFVFVLQFFRDPERTIPNQENVVLAPADGRIIVIEPTEDPWLHRDSLKISIFMNVFNVHSNRSPVDAIVKARWYRAGKFINADFDKASTENERNALWLQTARGDNITCVQVAGLIARRILCYVDKSDALSRGQRYGFIRFGSRVDLFLPRDSKPLVTIGDHVSASATILAELPAAVSTESITQEPK